MPSSHRRRTRNDFEADDDYDGVAGPSSRHHRVSDVNEGESGLVDEEGEENPDNDATAINAGDATVHKLVRYALSCEYARQPIRRSDISIKVFNDIGGPNNSGAGRNFKHVFARAQKVLEEVFGMRMVELPPREKVTISQKRAAQKAERASSSTKTWVLTTTLPSQFRVPDIIQPPQAPTSILESSYIALYTIVISLITLSGGSIPEERLERYFRRMGAEMHTPVDRTERVMQRLLKEGYIVKNRSLDSGEEIIEYTVGPRGKVEVGKKGVAALVGEVYGFGRNAASREPNPWDREDNEARDKQNFEDFQARLRRSLGLVEGEDIHDPADHAAMNAEVKEAEAAQTQSRKSRRASRRNADDWDGEEE
ncbi:hypothetical protein KEM56_007428 [Ascosphaera pollenicola]|nr:hypothetical protein KEM56_007428 [Ascosphaera pollenicola]